MLFDTRYEIPKCARILSQLRPSTFRCNAVPGIQNSSIVARIGSEMLRETRPRQGTRTGPRRAASRWPLRELVSTLANAVPRQRLSERARWGDS